MHRWSLVLASSFAILGLACGDDDGGDHPDASIDAAEPSGDSGDIVPDGSMAPDDAGEDPSQAHDASQAQDAGQDAGGDAGGDAGVVECEDEGGCTSTGTICTSAGAVTCGRIAGGCFAPVGDPEECDEDGHEVCKPGVGCECDEDPACGPLDGDGKNGAGTHCGTSSEGNTIVACVADSATGCVFETETSDTRTCAAPLVCGGSPGAADCVCPELGSETLPGIGCETSQRTCADDGGSVVVCQEVIAADQADEVTCHVWDDGYLVPDDPNDPDDVAGDDCAGDGLSCPGGANPQCICPANDTSDFYVNAHPVTALRRALSTRAGLVQNGSQRPTICSFDSATVALQHALTAIGPGNASRSRVILDNEDDPDGSIDSWVPAVGGTALGKARVAFHDEQFPWIVPAGVEIITVDRGSAGAPAGTRINPDHFTVVVDDFDNDQLDGADYGAAVNVIDTGLISGFTLIEGGCDVLEPDTLERDGSFDDYCYDKYASWPNVMVQVLDQDGIRNPVSRNIEAMHVHGGGGPDPEDSFRPTVTGGDADGFPEPDGAFELDAATGLVAFTPDDDNALEDVVDAIDDGATVFVSFFEEVIVPGSDGPTGSFGPVQVLFDESSNPIALVWYDPRGTSGTYAGYWSYTVHDEQYDAGFEAAHSLVSDPAHSNRKTIDVGILVGRDDLQGLDDGLPADPEYTNTNAELHDVRVSYFASRMDSPADMSRYGVIVDDDYPGTPPASVDAVSFFGGLLLDNDTGMLVSDGHVDLDSTRSSILAHSPGSEGRFEIAGSSGQGLEVYDREDEPLADPHVTTVRATAIYVHDTLHGDPDVFAQQDRFASSPYFVPGPSLGDFSHGAAADDLDGNGINVTGPGASDESESQLELIGAHVDRNAENGLSIVNTANAVQAEAVCNVTVLDSVLDGNGRDGVRLKYGAYVLLQQVEASNNGDNGVHVETSVRSGVDPGLGAVELIGGHIHDNGLTAVANGGHGILAQGDNTLIADGYEGSRLLVEHNGFGGLYADNGRIQVARTTFERNGANDLCVEDDEEGHFMQVTITTDDGYYERDLAGQTEATMSMIDCDVVGGYGGGIEIDSVGELANANVIGDSRIEHNEGVRDCDSEDYDVVDDSLDEPASADDGDSGVDRDSVQADVSREYAERDGVEVTRDGRLFFVSPASSVASNGKNVSGAVVSAGVDGIEIAGQLPLPTSALGTPVGIVVTDNTGDGITVSCGPRDFGSPAPAYAVCGFAQLRSGESTANDQHGAVVHGHLFWQGSFADEARIASNGADGVLVDHAESTDVDGVDCSTDPGLQPCELAEEAADAPDLSHALGWTESGSFRADIRTELLDVTIDANGANGVRVVSAPFAIESDEVPGLGNGCRERTGAPEPFLSGPVMDSEIEDTDPVCAHVTGFRIHSTESTGRSTVKYNDGWAFSIGADDQERNVYALIGDTQIYDNLLGGIDVHQNTRYGTFDCAADLDVVECRCDDTDLPQAGLSEGTETVGCTATTILSNNIFNNGGPGMFVRRSQQKPIATQDRRTISSNDVHHNAIAGASCQPADVQTFSQVHFEGKIILADPDITPEGLSDGSHPADTICYLGADLIDPPLSETQCDRMNDPEDPIAGGINNHCLWTGTQCRVAWDMAGTVGTGECGTSDNRIFAYVNNPSTSAYTQKGVVADDGAFVLARRTTWGVGGADNGTYATSGSDSEIDFEDACSTISTCTGPSPD